MSDDDTIILAKIKGLQGFDDLQPVLWLGVFAQHVIRTGDLEINRRLAKTLIKRQQIIATAAVDIDTAIIDCAADGSSGQ